MDKNYIDALSARIEKNTARHKDMHRLNSAVLFALSEQTTEARKRRKTEETEKKKKSLVHDACLNILGFIDNAAFESDKEFHIDDINVRVCLFDPSKPIEHKTNWRDLTIANNHENILQIIQAALSDAVLTIRGRDPSDAKHQICWNMREKISCNGPCKCEYQQYGFEFDTRQ
jgi:hypothetical protein